MHGVTVLLIMEAIVVHYGLWKLYKNQRVLKKQCQEYRRVLDNIPAEYVEVDIDGIIKYATSAFYKDNSQEYQQGVEIDFRELFLYKQDYFNFQKKMKKHHRVDGFKTVFQYGKEKKYIWLRAVELKESCLVSITDISSYEEAEHEIVDLSAKLNALFEAHADYIWILDGENFTIESFNQNYRKDMEYLEQPIYKGIALKDAMRAENLDWWIMNLNRALRGESFSVEFIKDKFGRIFEYTFYPIDMYNHKRNVAVFARDITQKKETENRIIELNRNLEELVDKRTKELKIAYQDLESFSYTVSHELKTPIREIDAYMECIEEDSSDCVSEDTREDMKSVRRICANTIQLVTDMMLYAKAGYTVLNKKKIDMCSLVHKCVEDLLLNQPDKQIQLNCYTMPELYGDEFLLTQAVANIISNSVKYRKKNIPLVIDVGCMENEKNYTYYFHDNGVGFDTVLSDKVFTLFNRLHNETEFEGNGVGLATVRRIIERHFGTSGIIGSKNQGCTVFWVFDKEKLKNIQ